MDKLTYCSKVSLSLCTKMTVHEASLNTPASLPVVLDVLKGHSSSRSSVRSIIIIISYIM